MEAWGTAGGCHQLQSGGVLREVFDSGGSEQGPGGRASCRSARKSFPKMSLDEFRERIMKC